MPFDVMPEKLVSDLVALRVARDGIATHWGQGDFGLKDRESHCLVGWLLTATAWDEAEAARLAVDYVWPALPPHARGQSKARVKIEDVWWYNDKANREHGAVLKVMDRAIKLAEKAV